MAEAVVGKLSKVYVTNIIDPLFFYAVVGPGKKNAIFASFCNNKEYKTKELSSVGWLVTFERRHL